MPTIAYFYGIYIRMFLKDHAPPHFHAIYGEFEAFIAIESGEVVHGKLPRRARRLVKEWTKLHRDQLLANWERGQTGLGMERIPGLDAEKSD